MLDRLGGSSRGWNQSYNSISDGSDRSDANRFQVGGCGAFKTLRTFGKTGMWSLLSNLMATST